MQHELSELLSSGGPKKKGKAPQQYYYLNSDGQVLGPTQKSEIPDLECDNGTFIHKYLYAESQENILDHSNELEKAVQKSTCSDERIINQYVEQAKAAQKAAVAAALAPPPKTERQMTEKLVADAKMQIQTIVNGISAHQVTDESVSGKDSDVQDLWKTAGDDKKKKDLVTMTRKLMMLSKLYTAISNAKSTEEIRSITKQEVGLAAGGPEEHEQEEVWISGAPSMAWVR